MTKINFALWTTQPSGGTRAIFEIADRLAKRNNQVTITSLYGNDSWFPLKNVKIKYSTLKGEYFLITKACQLFSRLTDFQLDSSYALIKDVPECDFNIATWYPTAFPVWFSDKGAPCYFMQDFPEQFSDKQKIKIFQTTLRLPFLFLTNSNFAKDVILQYQPSANVSVIGVGVNKAVFYPRTRKPRNADRKVVMCLLYPWGFKGGDIALKVLSLVNQKIPLHAILVGSKIPLNNFSKNMPIDFPYTYFKFVSDETLAELYSSADAFLFTSYAESFGLPPLEAMSCGTTVITTDCKGNRDYAVSDYNCLIAPPGDVIALAKALTDSLENSNLSENLRVNGLETAKCWTWDRIVDNFEKALKNNS